MDTHTVGLVWFGSECGAASALSCTSKEGVQGGKVFIDEESRDSIEGVGHDSTSSSRGSSKTVAIFPLDFISHFFIRTYVHVYNFNCRWCDPTVLITVYLSGV